MHASLLTADDLPAGDAPLLVGFSGGLDSTVLLHALAALPAARARGLRAVHVDHGLHADAGVWAGHCEQACATLGIAFDLVRVQVARERGEGPEAAARAARYGAFVDAMREGEVLALAHHRDDQAETFLLRALRGSGVEGLAAMRPWRPFLHGWLWRPLLALPQAALREYARALELQWLDDPSNTDLAFDRNFLRHLVLPLLHERWPQADAGFARSAGLQAQAQELLEEEDRRLLALARAEDGHTLDVDVLARAPAARRARALRAWTAALGLPPLPAQGIAQVEAQLLATRTDAEPRFAWAGAELRRWRRRLHADWVRAPLPGDWRADWDGATPLVLPTGDVLVLAPVQAGAAAAFAQPLQVRARRGGERIRLPGRAHSHALKHVLQERAVPPWVRERLPLLLDADGTVLAAGDVAVADGFARWLHAAGLRLEWRRDGAPD